VSEFIEPQAGNAKDFLFSMFLMIWNLTGGGVRGQIQKRFFGQVSDRRSRNEFRN
jgi:hypothetical protein